MRKWAVIAGMLFIVVFATLGGVAAIGYSGLSVESAEVERAEPALDTSLGALGEAALRLLAGDSLGAANRVVAGLDVIATLEVRNDSSIPVYIPTTTHILVFGGVEIWEPASVSGGFLSSGETMMLRFEAFVPKERIPEALLAGLVDGGRFQLEVTSSLDVGPLTVFERDSTLGFSLGAVVRSAIDGR